MQLTYDLDFGRYLTHFVEVRVHFVAKTDAPTVWLPTWIAGSYLIREFAKNITAVHYHTLENPSHTQRATKINKNTWTLSHIKAGQSVQVCYEVYCYDTSVRTAYIDHQRIFANFSSLLVIPTGDEHELCQIHLHLPKQFTTQNQNVQFAYGLDHQVHTTSDKTSYALEPITAFECYDYPFEISTQDSFSFDIHTPDGKCVPHRFFVSGVHFADLDRLKKDVQTICQAYVDWLGWTPFHHYTFLTHATGNDYGGLEHINSTALVTPRNDLPKFGEPDLPSDDYQRFLGLCSHEYFHAWWVKSVRPDVMMTSQLQSEAYTPLLWVFEGFTSYIDDLMLYRSGVIDKKSYFALLSSQINRYENTHGRHKQTVAESSFDAWIKLYRPDENSQNSTISYYNKGALVSLVLDLLLIQHDGGRIFDIIKDFTDTARHADNRRFGMTTQAMYQAILARLPKKDTTDFFDKYINGVEKLDLAALFTHQHIQLAHKTEDKPWGLTLSTEPLGLKITHVHPDGAGAKAGLSAGDVIVAVDGLKATTDGIHHAITRQAYFEKNNQNHPINCHIFRKDELIAITITQKTSVDSNQYQLHAIKDSVWPYQK